MTAKLRHIAESDKQLGYSARFWDKWKLLFAYLTAKADNIPKTIRNFAAVNNQINNIQDGTEDFSRFNLSERVGLCMGDAPLIGASIVAGYATASITAGSDAEGRQGECKPRLKRLGRELYLRPHGIRGHASRQCLH